MSAMASEITSLTIVCSIVYWGADQRKHQSSALLAFVQGIHRWPLKSPHRWPVTRKMFPIDDVIMQCMHVARAIVYSHYYISFYYKSLAIFVMGRSVDSNIISTMIRLCLVWPLEMCECKVAYNCTVNRFSENKWFEVIILCCFLLSLRLSTLVQQIMTQVSHAYL